jgi:FAD synthetase
MSLETLVGKYIASAEEVLSKMQQTHGSVAIDEANVSKVVEYVRAYVADAKYYKAQQRFETSLTSIAYCEGLLDALRLLGAVKFEWPQKPVNEK